MQNVRQAVTELNLPPDYRVVFTGRAKSLQETFQNFLIAFGLAMIFMYMILAAQFEHFVHPVSILLAVPLPLPFALLTMIPIALGTGPGSGGRASMAKIIIGGQMLCLLLTLLITPVTYAIFDDWGAGRLGKWRRGRRRIGIHCSRRYMND